MKLTVEHKVVSAGYKGFNAWMVCSCGYLASDWTMSGASIEMTVHIKQGNSTKETSE